jgi:hypothetical protein
MWKDIPVSISYGVTFFAVLEALTLIFVGMMSSIGRVNMPCSAPSSISDSGSQYLDELSQRANKFGTPRLVFKRQRAVAVEMAVVINIPVRFYEEERQLQQWTLQLCRP